MRYCNECAGLLEKKEIEGCQRLVCSRCGKIHYQNPLPVVAGVIIGKEGQILLTKRGIPPGEGKWALLAGFVERGESPEEAMLREIREEIGIEGKPEGLIGVYKGKAEMYGSVIVIGYKIVSQSEAYTLSKEVKEVRLFSRDHLPSLAFSSHRRILDDLWRTRHRPVPTVDAIIEKEGGIVLIKRKNPPYGWALPGGFVNYGELLEEAARRELKEETNLEAKELRQFHTYSDPGRDPRFHTITTVFIGKGEGEGKPADDAEELKVFKKRELPSKLAFDHKKILEDYFNSNLGGSFRE